MPKRLILIPLIALLFLLFWESLLESVVISFLVFLFLGSLELLQLLRQILEQLRKPTPSLPRNWAWARTAKTAPDEIRDLIDACLPNISKS